MARKVFGLLIGASLGLAAAVVPAQAHHAFAAAFDANALVTVQGVITEVKLVNPHSWFMLDATDEKGVVTHWEFEGQTPTGLMTNGTPLAMYCTALNPDLPALQASSAIG